MNIPLIQARLDEHDEVGEVGSLPSVIVNRTGAERFGPGRTLLAKESTCREDTISIVVWSAMRYTGLTLKLATSPSS
jgi:hypothetical protein